MPAIIYILSHSEAYYPDEQEWVQPIRRCLVLDQHCPQPNTSIANEADRNADLETRWEAFFRDLKSKLRAKITERRYDQCLL